MALQLRSKCRTIQNPRFAQLFSSSSSSYSRDVKNSLKQQSQAELRHTDVIKKGKNWNSLQELNERLGKPREMEEKEMDNFSMFPDLRESLMRLHKRRDKEILSNSNGDESKKESQSQPESPLSHSLKQSSQPRKSTNSFEDIRKNVGEFRRPSTAPPVNHKPPPSSTPNIGFQDFYKRNQMDQSKVLGGSEVSPPSSVFSKDLGPKSVSEKQAMKNELNDRLGKPTEMEEKEMDNDTRFVFFKDVQEHFKMLRMTDEERLSKERLGGLFPNTQTPEYEGKPPKEHLVEQYFHSDNMNSEEKLKLELQKVRDESKMSESDCGSSRVQGMGFQNESDIVQSDVQKIDNVTWTVAMDRKLLDTLKEQQLIGNIAKGRPKGWKTPTFLAVAKNVQQFSQQKLTKDHVQNRLKIMRRMMKDVNELMRLSGFGWCPEKKMLQADDSVWDDAIALRPKMKYLKNKSIELYIEMLEVMGDEPAIGVKETTSALMDEDQINNYGHVDPFLGSDAILDDVGSQNVYVEEGLGGRTTLAQSSSSVLAAQQIQRKSNHSMVASLTQEINGMQKEIRRLANAMDKRNNMNNSCWDECKHSLEKLNWDLEMKLDAIDWLLPNIERRKVFLTLNAVERERWLVRNITRERGGMLGAY